MLNINLDEHITPNDISLITEKANIYLINSEIAPPVGQEQVYAVIDAFKAISRLRNTKLTVV